MSIIKLSDKKGNPLWINMDQVTWIHDRGAKGTQIHLTFGLKQILIVSESPEQISQLNNGGNRLAAFTSKKGDPILVNMGCVAYMEPKGSGTMICLHRQCHDTGV